MLGFTWDQYNCICFSFGGQQQCLCKWKFLSTKLQNHLQFWLKKDNLLKGCKIFPQNSSKVITTDASKIGYGGHMGNQLFQGSWSVQDKKRHINQLEMKAVTLTVRHFLPQLRGHTVLIRSDNTTVVQCINKQGSTKSVQMCYQTWDLWHLALENKITLKAAHVAGSWNILADNLSRVKFCRQNGLWRTLWLKDCFGSGVIL